jgi:hypothetical protein
MKAAALFAGCILLASCASSSRPRGSSSSTGSTGGSTTGASGGGDLASLDEFDLASHGDDDEDDGGSNRYGELGSSDSGQCQGGQKGMSCASPIAPNDGCKAHEDCGPSGHGNGLDDDCNGKVDDTCSCTPGDVEKCFLGPPGKHGVGACTDGNQTCFGSAEFGTWGDCLGSIGPTPEACDNLDNDCNGCADDGLCCGAALDCPAPNDPRIAPKPPYTDVALQGEKFYTGGAVSWSWKVVGGPCDQLFSTTTGSPPVQSFTLTNGDKQDATVHFTLSGDYTITMTVMGSDGKTYTCTWVQHVIGPGVRFELCWDHTGSAAAGGADLDLHVHKPGSTTTWFKNGSTDPNTDDCFFSDCNPDSYFLCGGILPPCTVPNWGYTASNINQCSGAPATGAGQTWSSTTKNCPNPRLDIDNINTVGKPENTNIDAPKNNDTFRAMVHYYGQDSGSSSADVEEHPIVNIYCGGTLKASYGAAPNQLSGFKHGSGYAAGQMWRVADVKAMVNSMGNTTDCTVSALHPSGMMSGYLITTDDTSY